MTNNCAIVLIDDNEVDLFLHEQLVKHTGMFSPIWSFKGSGSALDHLATLYYANPKAKYPIVILLDIKMPDIDGFSFIKKFEKLPLTIQDRCRIVMLSATLQVTDTIRAEANPTVAAFLAKPLTIKSLKEVSASFI